MAHVRMGVCDVPASRKSGMKFCPYCNVDPPHILQLQAEPQLMSMDPRSVALFPNIPMFRRVPDLLHMVKNVTK